MSELDSDAEWDDPQAEVRELEVAPVAGPTPKIESGYVHFCGGKRLKVTDGDLETTGFAVPNGLKGTLSTSEGDVTLDVQLSISIFRLGSPTVTGGTVALGDKKVTLKKSQLKMTWDGWTPVSLAGTVESSDCKGGFVMSIDFSR